MTAMYILLLCILFNREHLLVSLCFLGHISFILIFPMSPERENFKATDFPDHHRVPDHHRASGHSPRLLPRSFRTTLSQLLLLPTSSAAPHVQRTLPRGDMWIEPLQVTQLLVGLPQFADLPPFQFDFDSFPSYP